MATIQTAIQLQDNFSQVLNGVINSINMTISSMEEMANAMDTDMQIDTSSLQTARAEIAQATVNLNEMATKVEKVEKPVQRVHSGFAKWERAIVVANQAVGLIQNTLGRIGVTDMSGAFSRLDTMNRFEKTITTMTGEAALANAALAEMKETTVGTAYGLDVASKSTQGFLTRGMELGAAANQVRIWADAVSFYGEGTNAQLESVVDAIGKMYSKGTVEADQLDRLFDAGIGAAEIYAERVGKSVSSVKEALSEGDISSATFIQTVSDALDAGISHGAAKEAGGTWATTFANMRAAFTRGWTSVIESADAALSAHGLPSSMEMVAMFGKKTEQIMNGIGNSMEWLIGIAITVGNSLGEAGEFVVDNWSIISPVIYGVGTMLLLYAGYLGVVKGAELATAAARGVATTAAYIHVAAMNSEQRAAGRAALAQRGLNSAMLACPVTWAVVGFVAIVAILGVVIGLYNKWNNTHISTMGAIFGTFNIAVQFFKNIGIAFANFSLGMTAGAKALGQNIGIAFVNAGYEAKETWYEVLEFITRAILNVTDQINALPFVDIDTTGLQNAASHYAAEQYNANASKLEYKDVGEAFTNGMLTYDVADVFSKDFVLDSYNQGYEFGEGLKSKISDKLDISNLFKNDAAENAKKIMEGLENSPLANIDKNTDKISKALDITSENIKYIRDFATERAINRYTSTTVKVDMTNHNSIGSDQDIDGIVNRLSSRIQEEMNASAEGVH